MTGSLIDDEQRGFRSERGYVDQSFTPKKIGKKAREKKRRVYKGFIDLKKAYGRVNREVLWQVLRMYAVGGKLLSGIKSMHVDISASFRAKGVESVRFRIDSGVS